MLGKKSKPELKAKGAECHGLVAFAVDLLEDNMRALLTLPTDLALKSQLLLEAGKSAVLFDVLLDEAPIQVSDNMIQRQLDAFLRHQMFMERAGEPLYPKHHMMIHGIKQQKTMGSLKKITHTVTSPSTTSSLG
jgi:hypothetical protein